MLFGALAWRFSQPPGCGTKALVSNARLKSLRPDGLVGVSVLQWFIVFKFFYYLSTYVIEQSVAKDLHHPPSMLHVSHTDIRKTPTFNRNVACSLLANV
jgi:hypothetical protein